MMGKIIVRITPDGQVSVGAEGAPGRQCHHLTNNIERALGKVETSTPTHEMYEQAQELGLSE